MSLKSMNSFSFIIKISERYYMFCDTKSNWYIIEKCAFILFFIPLVKIDNSFSLCSSRVDFLSTVSYL